MPAFLSSRQADVSQAFSGSAGQFLLALSRDRLQPLVDGVYGAHALVIGPERAQLPELSAPMNGLRLCVEGDGALRGEVRASSSDLPLPSDSIALVVLQYAQHLGAGEALLGEVARVLAPEGVALIVGINRLSAWNLWAWRRGVAWSTGVHACRRVLAAGDVDTLQVRRFGSFLPLSRRGALPGSDDGRSWLGCLRASYLLLARKRRAQVTPMRFAQVRRGAAASPGLAGSFRKAG
jgi:SAM-dependent methyltransferase